jgi:hypothetical protein
MKIWVCLKIEKTPTPNGFADHYPYISLLNCYNWGYTPFSDIPISTTGDHLRKWSGNGGIHPWCFSIGDFDRGFLGDFIGPGNGQQQSMGDLENVAMLCRKAPTKKK